MGTLIKEKAATLNLEVIYTKCHKALRYTIFLESKIMKTKRRK